MTPRPTSLPTQPRAPFSFTSGSATAGQSCFPTRRISPRYAQPRAADIEETQGYKVNYPMIGDPKLKIAKLYDMLPGDSGDTSEGRTAATNATVRTVFVIGPDKKIKLTLSYPMSTGRNFDEVLRVLDSIQLTARHKVATPVNWKAGGDVIILPSISDEDARRAFPAGWKTVKPYLRIVPQPADPGQESTLKSGAH